MFRQGDNAVPKRGQDRMKRKRISLDKQTKLLSTAGPPVDFLRSWVSPLLSPVDLGWI